MDLDEARRSRIQRVSDFLVEYSIIDLVQHFRQRCRFRDLKSWSQVRQGTVIRSRCDYILRTYWCRFNLVGIRDMRNYSYNHFSLREWILRCPTRCHAQSLQVMIAFFLILPPTAELIRVRSKFHTLKTLEPVTPKLKRIPCYLWMSPDSIRLIDKRTAMQQNPQKSHDVARGRQLVRWCDQDVVNEPEE